MTIFNVSLIVTQRKNSLFHLKKAKDGATKNKNNLNIIQQDFITEDWEFRIEYE